MFKKAIIRLFRLWTGKTQEQLCLSFSFYYFLTRNTCRAYWIIIRYDARWYHVSV